MERRLITSALPYVNNIPHLGNLIQVLSADVFARYCRLAGYDALYICGTDEYGTATETKALEEGITPRELCDRYYAIHRDIYAWFNIGFDHFGRTSVPVHTEITQHIFLKLYENGYITQHVVKQLYCEHDQRFLADRYVLGTCPNCGYPDARGDQCENCGKLLEPTELIDPRCSVCGNRPVIRETTHLFIDLLALLPKLRNWIESAAEKGFWSRNAVQMTYAWMRDGLKERAITRDLKWGIPVPLDGFRNKVFYVWFDACIGYISITAEHTPEWKSWWYAPESVKLFQFIGKDNIPFHTVIFPSSQLGTGESWTTLFHMSATEYLNYEGGKFSKSKGIGVFGSDAKDTGIPPDVWRFYIYYNRPERADSLFTWKDFQEKVNAELIGNLGNLVNRTLQFVTRFYGGAVPSGTPDVSFWQDVKKMESEIAGLLERVELRDAFRRMFALSSLGNKRFQDGEPWKGVTENPEATANLICNLVYLVRDLAILVSPYVPSTAERIAGMLGVEKLRWSDLGVLKGVEKVRRPELLFSRLEDKQIEELRLRFSGTQKERAAEAAPQVVEAAPLSPAEIARQFRQKVDLRAAKIVAIRRHPDAEKLYIETVDLGSEKRTIVSGLVPYYTEDELLGHTVVLVANLKPAILRGVESKGMLLAAQEGKTVEVLFVDHAQPGERVTLKGGPSEHAPAEIDIDTFFTMPIVAEGSHVLVGDAELEAAGRAVVTSRVAKGRVK
ncbi:MAG TPA: methionine--tRNA ligase [Spirochaetia bacterium]|nr:methionine--tRNA ligase [Spirochaetia bacterium]